MKQIAIALYSLLLAGGLATCATETELPDTGTEVGTSEVNISYTIDGHIATKVPDYASTITHMRILVFYTNNVLYKQVVIPQGANAPNKLRLPWGQYYIVFAGNFPTLSVTPEVTTFNDLLVSMNQDPSFTDPLICVAPTNPYYYYKVPVAVQFGVVGSINATLTPISSKVVFKFNNIPAYYMQLKTDIRGIGKSLSLQGQALAPSVRVIKTITGLLGTMSDSTYTFSSISTTPYVRLYATDALSHTDSLDFNFVKPIVAGNSYKIIFLFPSSPVISSFDTEPTRLKDVSVSLVEE